MLLEILQLTLVLNPVLFKLLPSVSEDLDSVSSCSTDSLGRSLL